MYKVGSYYIGRYLYVIPIRLAESVVDNSKFVVLGTFSRIDISVGDPGMSLFSVSGLATIYKNRTMLVQCGTYQTDIECGITAALESE